MSPSHWDTFSYCQPIASGQAKSASQPSSNLNSRWVGGGKTGPLLLCVSLEVLRFSNCFRLLSSGPLWDKSGADWLERSCLLSAPTICSHGARPVSAGPCHHLNSLVTTFFPLPAATCIGVQAAGQ